MSTSTWPVQPKSRWREHPERLAWIILCGGFALFLLLVVTVPLVISYTFENFPARRQALLEPTQGTLRLTPFRGSEPIVVGGQRSDIRVGSVIEAVEETTQGMLSFGSNNQFEQRLGSIQFYAGTTIEIEIGRAHV